MVDLTDVFILLLFATAGAWLWRGHGIRERALALVRRHCAQADIILLDDNVALQRLRWLTDSRGQRRLARVYGFEFTVTGEQRHTGSISMFGQHLGKIELAAHPISSKNFSADSVLDSLAHQPHSYAPEFSSFNAKPRTADRIIASYSPETPNSTPVADVIQLHDWRQKHPAAGLKNSQEPPAAQPVEPPPTRH